LTKKAGVAAVSPPTVVYIAGSGRSGSTLVERALGAIPGFVNVGELIDLCRRVAPKNERCGCGRAFADCPFWHAVGSGSFGEWDVDLLKELHQLQMRVARQRHLPRLLLPQRAGEEFRRALARYAELYAALYGGIAEEAGARVVVDASKWPAQALALAQGGVDVRVIHLLRDPRGVAYSLSKSDIARPHAVDNADLMAHSSPAEAAVRWSLTQGEVGLLQRLAVPVSRMRYENFVSRPTETIRAALLGLAIPVGHADLEHLGPQSLELGTSHGLSGNPSRFRAGTITLQADDQWKTRMSASQRGVVSALTLPALVFAHHDRVRSAAGDSPRAGTEESLPAAGQWPTVSVLVATRGRPQLVREAITSIVDQSYPGAIECLVIHDQEPPDPALESLGRPDRQVTVLPSRSTGLAGARNTGLDAASAGYIATCDDDDSWHPRKLELQIARLLAEPDLLLVGSGIRLRLPKGKVADWPGRADRIDRRLLLRNRVKELHSSTLVMRRDAFAKAGRYDEGLPNGYAEDYDWVLRASRVGRIGIVRTPLADIRKDVQSYYTGQSENTVVALKHFLAKHPEIAASRRGHARLLGQLAFHLSASGRRDEAVRTIAKALWRWPLSPYTYVALLQLLTGAQPQQIRRAVRLLGRGMA
jgi:hypothetical protein